MDIQIEKLANTDIDKFIELVAVFEEVFEMEKFTIPPNSHLQTLLGDNSFLVFVAVLDGKIVGGLTAYTLTQYYSVSPLVYIYDLAVKTQLQRKGIGRKLISGLNVYCKENGVQEVFVQADFEDGYAVDFYRLTGGQESAVVNFSYPLESSNDI